MHQDSETVQSQSRREFLKGSVAAGTVCVVVSYLDLAAAQPMGETLDAQPPQAPKSWENSDRTVPFRYDGHVKVMGKKIYARDLRARDLKGWPRQEQRVAILRVHHADRIFLGPDLERIKSELGVTRVVTGDQIEAAGVKPDGMFVGALMAIPGRVPVHLGQVAAILYFPDNDTFLELFSYAKDGSFPGPWEDPDEKGSVNARAAFYASKVQSELENPAWSLFRASYTTQGIDPMFMEPECGLAWYDSNRKELQLTWGTQSPS